MASAGITAVVVGFAAKSTLANLVSDMMLWRLYRPFRIGDHVNIENENGTVEDITLRHTIVRTRDNKQLIIPNEKIDSMSLINYTAVDPRFLTTVDVGISYDSDIDRARAILLEEARACSFVLPAGEEPDGAPQEPYVRVVGLGDLAVNLRLFAWTPKHGRLLEGPPPSAGGGQEALRCRGRRDSLPLPLSHDRFQEGPAAEQIS